MAELELSSLGVDVSQGTFTPCAYYSEVRQLVQVFKKDCSSYSAEYLNGWVELLWEQRRPWWKLWRTCVGFTLHCPPKLGFSGEVRVRDILLKAAGHPWYAIKNRHGLFYELAGDLTVKIPKK